MALPSYVLRLNVKGDIEKENVVPLSSSSNLYLYLLWDELDYFAQQKFDEIYVSSGIIAVLKNTKYNNRSFYDYLRYAFVQVEIGPAGDYTSTSFSASSLLNNTFNRENASLRVGKYSSSFELATFQATHLISYISDYGTSYFRDDITLTGTGTTDLENRLIKLSSGTDPGSSVSIATVEKGRNLPGKASQMVVPIILGSPLTGDQKVSIILGDDVTSARFEIGATTTRIITIIDGVEVESVETKDWNLNNGDGTLQSLFDVSFIFDPLNKFYPYVITFAPEGKIIYSVESAIPIEKESLNRVDLHEYNPEKFDNKTYTNKRPVIRVEVDNGTTNQDVVAYMDGRSYVILSEYTPVFRRTILYDTVDNFPVDRRVVYGVRKKTDFPSVGSSNSVPVFLSDITTFFDQSGVIRIYSVPKGTMGGVWGDLPEITNQSETSLEYNNTVTDITGLPNTDKHLILGPILITTGQKNKFEGSSASGFRIPIVNGDEFVIELDMDVVATGSITATMLEEW